MGYGLPETTSFVHLQILDAGSFLASRNKMHQGEDESRFRMYNWAFFILDSKRGRKILWDLGLSDASSSDGFQDNF